MFYESAYGDLLVVKIEREEIWSVAIFVSLRSKASDMVAAEVCVIGFFDPWRFLRGSFFFTGLLIFSENKRICTLENCKNQLETLATA